MTRELTLLDGQLTAIQLNDPDDSSLIGPQWIHSVIALGSGIAEREVWQRIENFQSSNEWEDWFQDIISAAELSLHMGKPFPYPPGGGTALVVSGYFEADDILSGNSVQIDAPQNEDDNSLIDDMQESICTFAGLLALDLSQGSGNLPSTKVRIGPDLFLVESNIE